MANDKKNNENNVYDVAYTALPKDVKAALGRKPSVDNLALLFGRLGNFADGDDLSTSITVDDALDSAIKFHFFHKSKVKKQEYHLDLTKKWHISAPFKRDYERFLSDYEAAIKSLHSYSLDFELQAEWRIALGMGNASVYENGFTFHPTYGMPYLPGSSLKGMTRHWAKAEGKDKEGTDYLKIFGNEQDGDKDFQQGQIIFFDALPVALEEKMVQPDIMNNHYPDYYEGNKPPADWLSPRPIFFLTMKGVSFQFHLGYIMGAGEDQNKQLLKTAKEWLENALKEAGVGAKTAVGYGRISKPEPSPGDEAQRSRQPQHQSRPK